MTLFRALKTPRQLTHNARSEVSPCSLAIVFPRSFKLAVVRFPRKLVGPPLLSIYSEFSGCFTRRFEATSHLPVHRADSPDGAACLFAMQRGRQPIAQRHVDHERASRLLQRKVGSFSFLTRSVASFLGKGGGRQIIPL